MAEAASMVILSEDDRDTKARKRLLDLRFYAGQLGLFYPTTPRTLKAYTKQNPMPTRGILIRKSF